MSHKIVLDGTSLVLEDLHPLLAGAEVELSIAPQAIDAVQRARTVVDAHVEAGDVVYGLTTGFGKLKNVAIAREDLTELQENLVLSHCCGTGRPMPIPEVRVAQVLRLNGLVRGHSGVRVELVERLVALFNAGFVPYVPQQGSVGASGDLAPLAHMVASYMGHGRAYVQENAGDSDRREAIPAAEALRLVGFEPLELAAKEGLALINGTEITKAVAVGVVARASNISRASDAIAAISIEALFCSVQPFDARFAELKGHAGHARTAANVRTCLADSRVMESHADCDRVQDPYSLRCVPQIHGAYKAALEHTREILANEINAVTDNPILFPDTGEVISAGQFHGAPVAMIMDYLALALCTIANVSERRTEQLVNPDLSHLPPFLATNPGLHSGLMMAQVAAASLASENKVLAHPSSVDTIPTSANQEDHVPMSTAAARKARTICDHTERILAIEFLAAAQAREFKKEIAAGAGVDAARNLLRTRVPPMDRDRYLADDIEAANELLVSGELVAAVEAAVGELSA